MALPFLARRPLAVTTVFVLGLIVLAVGILLATSR